VLAAKFDVTVASSSGGSADVCYTQMALAELHLMVVGILGSSPFAYAKTGRFSVFFFVREQDELHSAAQARA
jgi:hypothetical protein